MLCTIQAPTNNLNNSIDFYSKLNFELIHLEDGAVFTDGKFILEINPERTSRAGLKIYGEGWRDTVDELREFTHVIQTKTGFLLCDPTGSKIYLEEEIKPAEADLSIVKPSVLGNFAGLSLETIDLELTLKIYQLLHFKIAGGSAEQGWISLMGPGDFPLAILKSGNCPHLFFNPSLSFFNGEKNAKVIEKIRELNIPITEEVTVFNDQGIVDNIIIRDPGGLGFFLFND